MRLPLLLLLTLSAAVASAQEMRPQILFTAPLAIVPGKETKVLVRGKNLDAVTEIASPTPGVEIKILGKSKSGPPTNYDASRAGDSQVELQIQSPKELPPGVLTITAKLNEQVSPPYEMVVLSVDSTVEEMEPNPGFKKFQTVTRGHTVIGAIHEGKNVDVFRVEAPGRLKASMIAAVRGALTDGLLTVYDEKGNLLGGIDDANGRDPVIELELPAGGGFVVVQEAIDNGGPMFPYLLKFE
jgi:hypothetical protein